MNLLDALKETGKAQLPSWGNLHIYVDEGRGLMLVHSSGAVEQYRWFAGEVGSDSWIPYPTKCEACKRLARCDTTWGGQTFAFLLKQHCTCKGGTK